MAYIVHRNQHFYAVAYDGVDPVTGRERRRWHPAGRSRGDAEAIIATLSVRSGRTSSGGLLTVGTFLAAQWMPRRRTQLRPTTAHRYAWRIEHYICPRIGAIPIRRLRVDHLDQLYADCSPTADSPAQRSRRRPCTTSMSSSAPPSPTPPAVNSSTSTSPCSPKPHDPNPERAEDPRPGPPSSYQPSSTVLNTCGSTRHCTWPPRPECDVASSPGCGGVTETTQGIGCRWPAAARASQDAQSRSRSRPAAAAAALTSTRPPKRSSPPGSPAKNTTDILSGCPTPCSPTQQAARCTPSRSANCSTGTSPAPSSPHPVPRPSPPPRQPAR